MICKAVGRERRIGTGPFERSSVAWTADGRLVVAADQGIAPRLYFGEEPVRLADFSVRVLADGTEKEPIYASRLMCPRVAVDSEGYIFVSVKAGTKELDQKGAKDTTRGLVLVGVYDGEEPEILLALRDVGHGVVDAERMPGGGCMVLGTRGAWVRYSKFLEQTERGTLGVGASGEKIQMRIGCKPRKGLRVVHACHNGYSKESSRYICTGGKALTWADFNVYPDQGRDENHPGLGVDWKKPMKATMGAVFGGKLCVNVALNGKLQYAADSLPVLAEATFEPRHGPQFVPHPLGGVLCLFNQKGRVKCLNVEEALAGNKAIADLGAGRFASGAMRGSRLAVACAAGGGLVVRERDVG